MITAENLEKYLCHLGFEKDRDCYEKQFPSGESLRVDFIYPKEISETQSSLVGMLDQLSGSDFDMRGLAELKKLMGGE